VWAVYLFCLGSVGLLLALMGCVGAWMEKPCMVNTYAVFLTLIAIGKSSFQQGARLKVHIYLVDVRVSIVNLNLQRR
jgi:hypothetical protein